MPSYICPNPIGVKPFPDKSGIKKMTVSEMRNNNVKEALDLLVNGNEISQLLLRPELTEKARVELTALRETATSEKLCETTSELENAQKKLDSIRKEISLLKVEKDVLNIEIASLTKKKELLINSVNEDNAWRNAIIQELDRDYDIQWESLDSENVNILSNLVSEFDLVIENMIKYWAKETNKSEEIVNNMFHNYPSLALFSEYIKKHPDRYRFDETIGEFIEHDKKANRLIKSIMVPLYVKSKLSKRNS